MKNAFLANPDVWSMHTAAIDFSEFDGHFLGLNDMHFVNIAAVSEDSTIANETREMAFNNAYD